MPGWLPFGKVPSGPVRENSELASILRNGPAGYLNPVPASLQGEICIRERGFKQLRLFKSEPFDPEDRPELRNRLQWVLEPGGIDILNNQIEEIDQLRP